MTPPSKGNTLAARLTVEVMVSASPHRFTKAPITWVRSPNQTREVMVAAVRNPNIGEFVAYEAVFINRGTYYMNTWSYRGDEAPWIETGYPLRAKPLESKLRSNE